MTTVQRALRVQHVATCMGPGRLEHMKVRLDKQGLACFGTDRWVVTSSLLSMDGRGLGG